MARNTARRRRMTGIQRFSGLEHVHPELVPFLRAPDKFSTELKRFPVTRPLLNILHERESVLYTADGRRKFITADVEVARLYREIFSSDIPSFIAAGPRENLLFDPRRVNAAVVVCGGTAPGTNAVIHFLAKRQQQSYGQTTGHLYGFVGGFRGLGRRGDVNFRPLRVEETEAHLSEAGCWLGMSRHREEIGAMVDTLEQLRIDILYVVGGDGTLEAAHRIAMEIERRARRIVVAGIPKTIDNDVSWCWVTFGFETAVHYAAQAITAFHTNIRTHERIGVIVLYGGHSGFMAANATLASGVADVCLIPEEPVTLEAVLDYVGTLIARNRRPLDDHALLVVAEGLAWSPQFRPHILNRLRRIGVVRTTRQLSLDDVPSEAVRSAFISVLTEALERRFGTSGRHSTTFVEPRTLISSQAPTAQDIRYCQRLAYNAVDAALAGYTDFLSSFWLSEYVLVPLHLIAGHQKILPVSGAFWTAVRESTGQPVWEQYETNGRVRPQYTTASP